MGVTIGWTSYVATSPSDGSAIWWSGPVVSRIRPGGDDRRGAWNDRIRPISAVIAWGDPRTTRDIDVIVRLEIGDLPSLKAELSPHDRASWIASPEDTVANKLVFGSEQDLKDAAGILVRVGDDVDEALLEERCRQLGVESDLQGLRARIDRADG